MSQSSSQNCIWNIFLNELKQRKAWNNDDCTLQHSTLHILKSFITTAIDKTIVCLAMKTEQETEHLFCLKNWASTCHTGKEVSNTTTLNRNSTHSDTSCDQKCWLAEHLSSYSNWNLYSCLPSEAVVKIKLGKSWGHWDFPVRFYPNFISRPLSSLVSPLFV